MISKEELAKKLSQETGFQVTWMKSCFHLWDGQNAWFPLYTSLDVRRKADDLTMERLSSFLRSINNNSPSDTP